MEKIYLDWQAVTQHCCDFADDLQRQGNWTKLIAITRGGLVPSALLARRLGINYIDTICLSSYDEINHFQKKMTVLKEVKDSEETYLIIDDLVDTGTTMSLVQAMLPNAYRACLYAKPKGVSSVHSFHILYPQDTWLVFPWEV